MGHIYAKTLFAVDLKFTFKWNPEFLFTKSGNPRAHSSLSSQSRDCYRSGCWGTDPETAFMCRKFAGGALGMDTCVGEVWLWCGHNKGPTDAPGSSGVGMPYRMVIDVDNGSGLSFFLFGQSLEAGDPRRGLTLRVCGCQRLKAVPGLGLS